MEERPQYYENTLKPIDVTATSLAESLEELRFAVRYGAEAIQANEAPQDKWSMGGMFKHFPGMYSYRGIHPKSNLHCIYFGQCGPELISRQQVSRLLSYALITSPRR